MSTRDSATVRSLILLGFAVLVGCALKVKNVKPPKPYDFIYLQKMATYAQAAYAEDATIRALCRPHFNDVSIRVIRLTNNKYFLATSTASQFQLLAIAGTENIENVLLDADVTRDDSPLLQIPLHRGFARAANLLYEDVKPKLLPGYRLQITGHSLGGAEAMILGMLLQSARIPVESIVTFGQPKVTTLAGGTAFKDLPYTRVVNQNDIVPELPLDPYRHFGPELVLLSGTNYSVVEERPISLQAITQAWQALQRHEAPAELPDHYIANYLVHLDSKLTTSDLIELPQR